MQDAGHMILSVLGNLSVYQQRLGYNTSARHQLSQIQQQQLLYQVHLIALISSCPLAELRRTDRQHQNLMYTLLDHPALIYLSFVVISPNPDSAIYALFYMKIKH